MADLAITGLAMKEGFSPVSVKLNVTAAAFDVVTQSTTVANAYELADALTVEAANAAFIILHAGSQNQFVAALRLSLGTALLTGPTLVVGEQYVVSATPGKIAPRGDLLSGQFVTKLFDGASPTEGQLSLDVTGIAVA